MTLEQWQLVGLIVGYALLISAVVCGVAAALGPRRTRPRCELCGGPDTGADHAVECVARHVVRAGQPSDPAGPAPAGVHAWGKS